MNLELQEEIRSSLAIVLGKEQGDLQEALVRLDGARASVTGPLGHYLSRRSYEKAWILLEGGDPEKGVCGS